MYRSCVSNNVFVVKCIFDYFFSISRGFLGHLNLDPNYQNVTHELVILNLIKK